MKRLSWVTFLGVIAVGSSAFADNQPDELLDLPIEQLLKIKVAAPAAITHFSWAEVPASVTLITDEDIVGSNARNIYDLLEIHVPGAIWMNHEKGPHPGIRGIIANQNYKYLLLVNGRVLNNKGYSGAKSELEMWDLGDIRRIEVIRGPGSVTYGPGAIAGVIHIVTHDAGSRLEPTLTATSLSPYASRGVSYTQSLAFEDFSWYGYASIRQTDGWKPKQFAVTSDNDAGYVGKDIRQDQIPLDALADFEEPQVKLHWDFNLGSDQRLWVRYTQQGAPWTGNETKTKVGNHFINQQSTRDRQLTLALEDSRQLADHLTLKTLLSFDSMDSEGRKDRLDDPDPDHPLNYRVNFAEHEILVRSRLNFEATESSEYALGIEYSKDYFGTGWGEDKRDMRLGEGGNIVSGQDSKAIREGNRGSADRDDNAFFVGNGWETVTYSIFSEGNFEWAKGQKFVISGRADRNTYTDWLFSPRLAWVSQLTDKQILKFIAQRSVRMNTAGQMYTEATSGKDTTNERLDGLELIYQWYPVDSLIWQASAFRNRIRTIGFEGDANLTKPLGTLDLYGLETELGYRSSGTNLAVNYSYVKQIKWVLEDSETSSGTSYSDYNEDLGGGIIQKGFGNDLSNWPNHALKLYGRHSFHPQFSLQGDARAFWHWQGQKDGLSALLRALDGTPEQEKSAATIKDLKERGVYGPEYRLGLSFTWQPSPAWRFTAFSQNLINISQNKRYAYDSGNDEKAPNRVRFIEEPQTVGLKVDWQIQR